MQPVRRARLASVILDELAVVVPREVNDPRVPSVTFTRCEVSPDGSQATVYVTFPDSLEPLANTDEATARAAEMASDKTSKDAIQGLQSASGFLRIRLTEAIHTRQVPALLFKEDKGFANTLRVESLLKQLHKPEGESR